MCRAYNKLFKLFGTSFLALLGGTVNAAKAAPHTMPTSIYNAPANLLIKTTETIDMIKDTVTDVGGNRMTWIQPLSKQP